MVIPDAAAADAAAPDAVAVDAAPPDGPINAVTVVVYQGGAPAANMAVYWHAANGSYVGSVMTDSSGTAVIGSFPEGGAVTAPVTGTTVAQINHLTTVTNVSVGDTIVIGKSPGHAQLGSVDVTFPGTTAGAGTEFYVQPGCQNISTSNNAGTVSATLYDRCYPTAPSTVDIVGYTGTNSLSNNLTGYSFATGVAITGTPPDLTGSVTLPDWSTDFAQHTVVMNNTPAGVSIEGQVHTFRNGKFYWTQRHTTYSVGSVMDLSQPLKYANGFFDEVAPAIEVLQSGGRGTVAVRSSNVATNAAPVTTIFDVATDPPARITDFAVSTDPIRATWTAPSWGCRDNPGVPDVAVIRIYASTAVATWFGSAQDNYIWTVITRGDVAAPFSLPLLEPTVASTLWPTSSFQTAGGSATFVSDSNRTWDDIRLGEDQLDANPWPPAAGTRCVVQAN